MAVKSDHIDQEVVQIFLLENESLLSGFPGQ